MYSNYPVKFPFKQALKPLLMGALTVLNNVLETFTHYLGVSHQ